MTSSETRVKRSIDLALGYVGLFVIGLAGWIHDRLAATQAPAPRRSARHFWMIGAVAALLSAGADGRAATRPIDAQRSTLTVHVYKSGLFSAFADNHVIKAPIASGSLSDEPPRRVELAIRAADLTVSDPDLSAERREEVQTRMLGAEVLDVAKFSEITFTSTSIEPTAAEQWKVTGRLTLHGQSRLVSFGVVRQDGRYRGDCQIKQRDFGIQPISIAGGTVKVKDEVKIAFDLAGAGTPMP